MDPRPSGLVDHLAPPSRQRPHTKKVIPKKRIWRQTPFPDKDHSLYLRQQDTVNVQTPLEYFSEYFDENFFKLTSECTNLNYMRKTGSV